MNQSTVWDGFHGTSALCGGSIVNENFRVSSAERDWLGNGAYFFIDGDGVTSAQDKAAEWAISRSSGDTKKGTKAYSRFSVLHATIHTGKHLDFDDTKHIRALNALKDAYIDFLEEQGCEPTGVFLEDKCNFCNFLMHKHNVDAIVRMEYIKTSPREFKVGFSGGVPNCRVMSVRSPEASVRKIDYAIERRKVK